MSERLGEGVARIGVPLLRRVATNLSTWIAALVRPARGPALHWQSSVGLASLAIAGVPAVGFAMLLLDSWAIARQRALAPWLVALFNDITDFGKSGWILYPLGALILCAAVISSRAMSRMTQGVIAVLVVRVGFLFTAVALPGLVITVIKRLIGRARPLYFDQTGPFSYAPFGWKVDFSSLPSGHSTTAFSAAVAIGALFPRARTAMWILAGIIAASRVAVAAHYPSDVIAGALVGSIGALIVRNWFARRRLAFAIAPDGTPHVRPGPSWQRLRRMLRQSSV